jgi:hypothetical protein
VAFSFTAKGPATRRFATCGWARCAPAWRPQARKSARPLKHRCKRLALCKQSFIVASPYVGKLFTNYTSKLDSSVRKVLVTRTDIRDFAFGASDLDAVCGVAELGGQVLSLPRLHAKVYIVDSEWALVTSANATFSGLGKNWECGVAISDTAMISDLTALVLSGFGSQDKPLPWTLLELQRLRVPSQILRMHSQPTQAVESHDTAGESVNFILEQEAADQLLQNIPGWMRLTFTSATGLSQPTFSLSDLYRVSLPLAKSRYPKNRFPREKIRQQLQRLRDIGLVEFLGDGRYRTSLKIPQAA